MSEFFGIVEQYRKRRGLSERQMADVAGIHYSSWSRFKNGTRRPTLTAIRKIVAAYPELRQYAQKYLESMIS